MNKAKKIILGMTIMSMMAGIATSPGIKGRWIGVSVVSAEEEVQGRCGDSVEYRYDTKTKTLTVSGTGAMWDDYGFAKNLKDTTNIIIEKGVTTIGSYSFSGLTKIKSLSIADTVTTIKGNAFDYIDGEIELPVSVTKVETRAFNGFKKAIIKGNVSGYETGAFGKESVYDDKVKIEEIVLYGTAPDLGKAIYGSNVKAVTIAKENKGCRVEKGCLMSNNGTQLYYCINNRGKVTIPDSVEVIAPAAFSNVDLDEVIFGQNVTTVGDFAFVNSTIKKLKLNKALKNIGVKSFYNIGLKKVLFLGKVKMDVAAFSYGTQINAKKFKYAQTTLNTAKLGKKNYTIKFAKVVGATGYEIRVKYGKKSYKYTTTKSFYTKKAPKKLAQNYDMGKKYIMENDEYLKTVDGAATVEVRPYQLIKKSKNSKKKKTVYGSWSQKMVLSK